MKTLGTWPCFFNVTVTTQATVVAEIDGGLNFQITSKG